MRFKRSLTAALLAGILAFGASTSYALELVRSIPIQVGGYVEAKSLPASFSTADQILSILNSSRTLAIHMEVLRQGYHQLNASEQERLLTLLLVRHREMNNDVMRYFDHGYAQVVYKKNQTGLFFLRKANDQMKNQFSSLAYAMAQAEVNIEQEQAGIDQMTTRKMDVTYKLTDAVSRDALAHLPGFWPTFVQVIQSLKTAGGAYNDYVARDFSELYVPYGQKYSAATPPPPQLVAAVESGTVGLGAGSPATGCAFLEPQSQEPLAKTNTLARHVKFPLSEAGQQGTATFYTTETPNRFKVRITDDSSRLLASLIAPSGFNIIEDIDADHQHELVVRQYRVDPLHPVKVYRFSDCGYQPDENIESLFK